MVGGDNDEYYTPQSLVLAAVTASSDSDPVISFGVGVQEAVATAVRYTKLVFTLFTRGYIRVILVPSSLSLSTSSGAGTDEGIAPLWAER